MTGGWGRLYASPGGSYQWGPVGLMTMIRKKVWLAASKLPLNENIVMAVGVEHIL